MLKHSPVWSLKLVPAVRLTQGITNIRIWTLNWPRTPWSSSCLCSHTNSSRSAGQSQWVYRSSGSAVKSDHSSCTSLSQHGNHTQKVSTCFLNMELGTSLRCFNELPEASCSFTCQLHPNYSWPSLLWRYYAEVIIKWWADEFAAWCCRISSQPRIRSNSRVFKLTVFSNCHWNERIR